MSVRPLLLLALATAAALVAGKTPAGFTPGTDTDLVVRYGRVAPPDGAVMDKAVVGSAPVLGTERPLPPGHEYAVIMIDLDVPFDVRPHVLLHWLQTGLRPAATASDDNDERRPLFALHDAAAAADDDNANAEDEDDERPPPPTLLAPYLAPAPPSREPLSHRYVQLLVDTTALAPAGRAALADAAATRLAFDVAAVLAAAGLQDRVVAGRYFNVTNPGPVDRDASSTTTTTTTTTTTAAASASASNTSSGAAPTASVYPDDDVDDLLLGRNSTSAGAAQPSGVNTVSAAAISSKAALAFSAAPPRAAAAVPPTLLLLLLAAVTFGHAL